MRSLTVAIAALLACTALSVSGAVSAGAHGQDHRLRREVGCRARLRHQQRSGDEGRGRRDQQGRRRDARRRHQGEARQSISWTTAAMPRKAFRWCAASPRPTPSSRSGRPARTSPNPLFGILQKKVGDSSDSGLQFPIIADVAAKGGLAKISEWAFRNVPERIRDVQVADGLGEGDSIPT